MQAHPRHFLAFDPMRQESCLLGNTKSLPIQVTARNPNKPLSGWSMIQERDSHQTRQHGSSQGTKKSLNANYAQH